MKITGIIETCLYATDLKQVKLFYMKLPGIRLLSEEEGRHLFFKAGGQMLLIFNPGHTSAEQTEVNGSIIPLHGCNGEGHVAFAINQQDVDLWKAFLADEQIPIESEVRWPTGTVSLYFRDPAGNSLEVVSPELWA